MQLKINLHLFMSIAYRYHRQGNSTGNEDEINYIIIST